eukprot:8205549-Ditylum_brightwellii.AAC.1
MMKHNNSDECDSYPPPFSLDGGLLSTLRETRKRQQQQQHDLNTSANQQRTIGCIRKEYTRDNEILDNDDNEPQRENKNSEKVINYNNRLQEQNDDNSNVETTEDVAILLTSIAEIASKEC